LKASLRTRMAGGLSQRCFFDFFPLDLIAAVLALTHLYPRRDRKMRHWT
jgi:hypothetical protein